jgi:hypothetical protein
MKTHFFVGVCVLAVVATGAYYAGMYTERVGTPQIVVATSTHATTSADYYAERVGLSDDGYEWLFSKAPQYTDTVPVSKVQLRTASATHDIATVEGTCSYEYLFDAPLKMLPGGVYPWALCWYAGGGTEYGIFKESGRLVVKKRLVDEGSAEEAAVEMPFEKVMEMR